MWYPFALLHFPRCDPEHFASNVPQKEPAALYYNGTILETVQVWAKGAYHNSIGRMHQCSQLIEIILSLDQNKERVMEGRDRERNS